ncbi:DUF3046 domain-containing protein [Leucobacter sp. M11]|uniref:DUF3046 domain-containing protein n=1 Tax=Leucobacter sp. M11 TaxID=2993565 RepID=UPI002D7FA9E0|nr:DUF3046 domain-containing protein [Leucobacter sp. M11]MEB4615897.1 DUF3046 domain-containing protein [Leucobacter sp. M11]
MRLSEFRRAVAEEFGPVHGPVLTRDQWLAELGGTVDEALAAGADPRDAWLALCREMSVPTERRHGRGLVDPR